MVEIRVLEHDPATGPMEAARTAIRCPLCLDELTSDGWQGCECGAGVHSACLTELDVSRCPTLGCERPLERLPWSRDARATHDPERRFVAQRIPPPPPLVDGFSTTVAQPPANRDGVRSNGLAPANRDGVRSNGLVGAVGYGWLALLCALGPGQPVLQDWLTKVEPVGRLQENATLLMTVAFFCVFVLGPFVIAYLTSPPEPAAEAALSGIGPDPSQPERREVATPA